MVSLSRLSKMQAGISRMILGESFWGWIRSMSPLHCSAMAGSRNAVDSLPQGSHTSQETSRIRGHNRA